MAGVRDRSTVLSTLAEVSERHNLPLGVLVGFGRIESGLRPNVKTGSYKGLFQLSNSEFKKHGSGGNIYNTRDNAEAFANSLKHNWLLFKARTGRDPTGAELYLMHQQGTEGAAKHLANPNQPAWVNMANTAEGRQKGVRWAKKAIWGNVPQAWKREFGSVENVSSADFTQMWKAKYEQASQWKSGTRLEQASSDPGRIPTSRRAALDSTDRLKGFRLAQENLKLNRRETRLYQRHLGNLWGKGGVDNDLGGRSTLLATTVGLGNRTYIIPTVWDGKILSTDDALKRARKEGLARFPSYSSQAKADARYNKMHEFMDMDTEGYQVANYKPSAPAMSELDTVGAEIAATKLPPPPPTFSVMLGGLKEPEAPNPSQPTNTNRTVVAARKPEGDESFFTTERLNDVFGQPFGELYQRPDQAAQLGQLPERPPLLRDLFRVA